ncbi:alpha/beta-Hydrolases superfamily protein [Trifolium repens]|nr:alpha/beta-Hydrolases superfamily protein [Trifolium repens]
MEKIHGVGVCNYHNILNMGRNQRRRNMLGPFLHSGLVPISLLGPLAREAQPNCPHRGSCAMLFLSVAQLILTIVLWFVIGVV